MSSSSQPDNERILRLVGAIVLVSQDAERYLKITLPFIAAEDSSLGASLKRHEKLKKRTLGELAGKFVDSTTSDSLDFAKHMAYLVATRNQVVHHFNETYGVQLNAGSYQEVFDLDRPAFRRHLRAIISGNRGGRYEWQAVHG